MLAVCSIEGMRDGSRGCPNCVAMFWPRHFMESAVLAFCLATLVAAPPPQRANPSIKTRKVLDLGGPTNENLATRNQAMNVWESTHSQREFVVGLTHQYNDIDLRSDDQQFIVAWESDGTTMREVLREKASCADVDVAVPSRGPYAYEYRMDASLGSLHPECSCVPSQGRPCPAGVLATNESGTSRSLMSPVVSHFVHLKNEWGEWIADPSVLGRLLSHVEAIVKVVSAAVINASISTQGIDPIYACPGTRDEPLGSPQVTRQQLLNFNKKLPDGQVTGGWCVVRRGWCSETAKVKVCELSGAVGTIIVDHGNFNGDQDISVTYNRAASEVASKPVLFLSKTEGEEIISWARSGSGVRIAVGPAVGGPPPPGYAPGSGIIVHAMTLDGAAPSSSKKSYPNVFDTAGWMEVSASRDLLFACQPQESAVFIFNVSEPLRDIPLIGKIPAPCSKSGWHDYRILDYKAPDGRYYTLVIDPFDSGNRLYYYDTQNPSHPVLYLEKRADWEAQNDGLGQVRAGGPNGRYQLITWHCANLYCGKNHGDALYVLNTYNLSRPASRIPIPQMGTGGFARDVSCGADALCLLSLTWDGLVAVDTGVQGTANPLSIVASSAGYFSNAHIPQSLARLRMHSGAQKVYSSKAFSRRFYVEHADFSLRPLRLGDSIRALQLTELWLAEVVNYVASERLPDTMKPHPPIYSNVTLGCEWKLAPMCVREFEYKGKTHTNCVTTGNGETGWCSHDAIFAGSWSSCVSSCVYDCSETGESLPGGPGAEFIIICPAGCGNAIVWGNQMYSDDSSMCAAAIHAGVTTRAGGRVMVTIYPGQESYPSVASNGVTSYAWGTWGRSFTVGPPGGRVPPLPTAGRTDACKACVWDLVRPCVNSFVYEGTTYRGCSTSAFGAQGWCSHDEVYRGRWSECTSSCGRACSTNAQRLRGLAGSTHLFICPAGCGSSTAWGTDIYGDDSSVCTAAIHAGVINMSGGCVVVTIAAGKDRYEASVRNGIKTFSWGAWERSFTVAVADQFAMTKVILQYEKAGMVGATAPGETHEFSVGVIAAFVAVSVVALSLGAWTCYLAKAYRRSQNMVQRLQAIPATGAGDSVVVGSPVCPDDQNAYESVTIGAPLAMPATVVNTNAWSPKHKSLHEP